MSGAPSHPISLAEPVIAAYALQQRAVPLHRDSVFQPLAGEAQLEVRPHKTKAVDPADQTATVVLLTPSTRTSIVHYEQATLNVVQSATMLLIVDFVPPKIL
jgi:hypothetical protein